MANYNSTIRTNYFHVKDEVEFRKFMSRVHGCEDDVQLWEETDDDGNIVFGFGVYGGISGVYDEQEDDDYGDTSYIDFIDGLQKHVANNDAIIILESGNEKMRYVIGSATIITSKVHKYLDITSIAVEEAAILLHNPKWRTKCEY